MSLLERNKYDRVIGVNTSALVRRVGFVILGIVLLVLANKMIFSMSNHEIVALTSPSGYVSFYNSPGIYNQKLGSTVSFPKNKKYETKEDIQFNDGAHADLEISVQYEVPQDIPRFSALYTRYRSPEEIESGLIETNIRKAITLTGRMMSSKESYAEKRGDLFAYLEDQTANGVYRTDTQYMEAPDDLDKTKTKRIIVTFVRMGKDGQPERIEKGLMDMYGIRTTNFTAKINYRKEVEDQIQAMQQQIQAVNQKIAEARMAEQNAVTIEMNGKAQAAAAKWEQEKTNARVIAEAEMQVAVAKQQKEAAALNKERQILEGQGEAEKKRLILTADGALTQKLATYERVNGLWADALKHYGGNITPQIVTGGGSVSQNAALNFQELMSMKAARDLGLDLTVKK